MSNGFDRPEEMQRLQQEAIRRVREMQSRARSISEREQTFEAPPPQAEKVEKEEECAPFPEEEGSEQEQFSPIPPVTHSGPAQKHSHSPAPAVSHKNNSTPNLLDALLSDSERTLILLVLLLLLDEKAETGLVLALMHLLL